MVGVISATYATALYLLKLGSISPTHKSPLTAPYPIHKQTWTLCIQSFHHKVCNRDYGWLLTGKRVLKLQIGQWDMFKAGHIFPLLLEPYGDVYDFTPKLFALTERNGPSYKLCSKNSPLKRHDVNCLFDHSELWINPYMWPTVFCRFHTWHLCRTVIQLRHLLPKSHIVLTVLIVLASRGLWSSSTDPWPLTLALPPMFVDLFQGIIPI